jgi:hypothetical protein
MRDAWAPKGCIAALVIGGDGKKGVWRQGIGISKRGTFFAMYFNVTTQLLQVFWGD